MGRLFTVASDGALISDTISGCKSRDFVSWSLQDCREMLPLHWPIVLMRMAVRQNFQ